MGVLKIKVNNTGKADIDWETINNLKLDNLSLKTGEENGKPKYEQVNDVIENAAVDVYIHVNSDGTNYTSTDPKVTDTGLTLMDWFNKAYPIKDEKENDNKARNKATKGFLIEHRTIETKAAEGENSAEYTTYHLPYYWQVSENEKKEDTSSWVLLNAIWG